MKGHVARKRFGQNFLVDKGIIAAIVAAIDPQRGDTVVEIGPGLGALTEPLLARVEPSMLTTAADAALLRELATLAATIDATAGRFS